MTSLGAVALNCSYVWEPTTALRWSQVPYTTFRPAVLEQAWRCLKTGNVEWRSIPLFIQGATT